MKTTFFFLFSFFLFSANAQCNKDGALTQMWVGGNSNFQMVGDESNIFVDSLFANLPRTKRKKYIWTFKDVQVPGVERKLTFEVHQGVWGVSKNKVEGSSCGACYYSHSYTSEKYKQERLSMRKESEKDIVKIFIREGLFGRKYGLESKEEVELVKAYLLAIYE